MVAPVRIKRVAGHVEADSSLCKSMIIQSIVRFIYGNAGAIGMRLGGTCHIVVRWIQGTVGRR